LIRVDIVPSGAQHAGHASPPLLSLSGHLGGRSPAAALIQREAVVVEKPTTRG
jgi:hypothetical protein